MEFNNFWVAMFASTNVANIIALKSYPKTFCKPWQNLKSFHWHAFSVVNLAIDVLLTVTVNDQVWLVLTRACARDPMDQGLLFQGTQRHQVCRRSEPVTAQYFVLVIWIWVKWWYRERWLLRRELLTNRPFMWAGEITKTRQMLKFW